MTEATNNLGSEEFYRCLFEHTGVAFVATDERLAIKSFNTAASVMFGPALSDMVGQAVVQVMPQDRRDEATSLVQRAIEHGESSDLEFQFKDRQGVTRELIATISPIVLESGERVGVSACFRDITRRINLQTQLHENRKMASLGQMAGAMAHHFNNILGGVVTSVDYANCSKNPVVKSRTLATVSEALNRATTLLKGLLNFAEGETIAQDLCNYAEIIHTLTDRIRPVLQTRRIELIVDVPSMLDVPVPCLQVTTVLGNIVENAIDAMPDGGSLRIGVELDDHWLVTSVGDTGCGLDCEALSRVFEPFWSTKGVLGGGTEEAPGLGLAIAHGIIQVLGGSISASSEPDQGACFIFSLPRKDWNPKP